LSNSICLSDNQYLTDGPDIRDFLKTTTKNLMFHLRARGKLLLTGEYFVLDGAWSLALPVRYGQSLEVRPESHADGQLHWYSVDEGGNTWFEAQLDLEHFNVQKTNHDGVASQLGDLLRACRAQNPDFLQILKPLMVEMQTDFPRAWGLGTSSTLVASVARWAEVDPYLLLDATFGGSGYDIACAFAEGPILYRRAGVGAIPEVRAIDFAPAFSEQLFWVYLGQKQDSREGIKRYRALAQTGIAESGARIADITIAVLEARTLLDFENLLQEHEQIVSAALQIPTVQSAQFADYQYGTIKSLGAWGGDFVLATSSATAEATAAYFAQKGCPICMAWRDMF
jgi:mevalonate kinase